MQKLTLVRGHDTDGENQDLFVIASGKNDEEIAIKAAQIWNTWCLNNGWDRKWGASCEPEEYIEPQNIRVILQDVNGTEYDGPDRGVKWEELKLIL